MLGYVSACKEMKVGGVVYTANSCYAEVSHSSCPGVGDRERERER